jgi:hypothetical protein
VEQIDQYGGTITLIHFLYRGVPDSADQTIMRGERWIIACMPNMAESEFGNTQHHSNHQRTNATAAVTCAACMETDAYKRAREIGG